ALSKKGLWPTTWTDRATSIGPPSRASAACATKGVRFWRRPSAVMSPRSSPILSRTHRSTARRSTGCANCSLRKRTPEKRRNEHDRATRLRRPGVLAGLLAVGGPGRGSPSYRELLWRTPLAALAVSAVGRRSDAVPLRSHSRQPLERV